MNIRTIPTTLVCTAALLLAACNPQTPAAPTTAETAPVAVAAPAPAVAPVPAPAPEVCNTCGVISAINVRQQQGEASGIGIALGALAGGIAGNQVGGGSGKKIATVAGAIGGAVLGNNIEKNRSSTTYHEIVIDMEAGPQQVINVPDASGIAVGSRVTVQGGNISLR